MNKLLLTAALALALVPNAHGQAAAASSGPLGDLKVSGDFDYESQYVFRGKKITNSAFQPSVDFTKSVADGTLKAYVWTSQPIGRAGTGSVGPNQTNEIDIGAYWDHAVPGVDNLTGEVGGQLYWYPDVGGNTLKGSGNPGLSRTFEFHVGAMYDTTSLWASKINLNPTVMWYHDVILDSNTFTAAINYSWDLSDSVLKGLSLNPTATLGWTGIGRSFGDVNTAGVGNWKNSYTFWELDLELDYVLSSDTTLYLAGHYAGNNDGSSGGFAKTNPQAPGSDNSVWLGLGVKWNM